jgi:hypothetical protein
MKLQKETVIHMLNSALDILLGILGREWLIRWAIDQGLTNEEICDWVYDDMDAIIEVRKEVEEEENGID